MNWNHLLLELPVCTAFRCLTGPLTTASPEGQTEKAGSMQLIFQRRFYFSFFQATCVASDWMLILHFKNTNLPSNFPSEIFSPPHRQCVTMKNANSLEIVKQNSKKICVYIKSSVCAQTYNLFLLLFLLCLNADLTMAIKPWRTLYAADDGQGISNNTVRILTEMEASF